MPVTDTPLRYPGGKTQLAPLVIDIMRNNNLFYGDYVETFAGGAGIAWKLLLNNYVGNVFLNDLDQGIYSFWYSVLNDTEDLCQLIQHTPITITEWHKQRKTSNNEDASALEKGFATFFLNRTNRSGIIRGGVIGGLNQDGNYKLDCRFNKEDLIRKIRRIASVKDRVHLHNLDALEFIDTALPLTASKTLVNIDPPYYLKGPDLYTNFYQKEDHAILAHKIHTISRNWMVTYDDVPALRELYKEFQVFQFELNYSAQTKRVGTELLILDSTLSAPEFLTNSRIKNAA